MIASDFLLIYMSSYCFKVVVYKYIYCSNPCKQKQYTVHHIYIYIQNPKYKVHIFKIKQRTRANIKLNKLYIYINMRTYIVV